MAIALDNYSLQSPKGYEGAPAGSIVGFDLRGTLEGMVNATGAAIPFGRVLTNKTNGQGLPANLDETVAGVSIGMAHYESDANFGGNAGTPDKFSLTVAKKAIIWMLAENAIDYGDSVFYRVIMPSGAAGDKALGRIRSDADALGITNVALTSNVATITTDGAHGFVVGQVVTIAGLTTTALNGTYTVVAVPTTTTFTFAKTNSNISSTADTGTIARAKELSGLKVLSDVAAGQLVRVEVNL
jgi:hypothetical protein